MQGAVAAARHLMQGAALEPARREMGVEDIHVERQDAARRSTARLDPRDFRTQGLEGA